MAARSLSAPSSCGVAPSVGLALAAPAPALLSAPPRRSTSMRSRVIRSSTSVSVPHQRATSCGAFAHAPRSAKKSYARGAEARVLQHAVGTRRRALGTSAA